MPVTPPIQLLRGAYTGAVEQPLNPVFLGCLRLLDIDRRRADLMAAGRRLWNEESDNAWGARGDRHRGDEAAQAKTWADGCLGEAALGRVLRSLRSKRLRLSAPLEWVPTNEPDLVFDGKERQLRTDFKSANYKRPDGRTSWTVNEAAHRRGGVDGYIATDLTSPDLANVWFYTKAQVEAGDLMQRESKTGKPSSFYRLFFPAVPSL